MSKTAFIGFGEVNTPEEVIVKNVRTQRRAFLIKVLIYYLFTP